MVPIPVLTVPAFVLTLSRMAVETLGEAFEQGWRVTARCAHGKIDNRTSARDCAFREEMDMPTLV